MNSDLIIVQIPELKEGLVQRRMGNGLINKSAEDRSAIQGDSRINHKSIKIYG